MAFSMEERKRIVSENPSMKSDVVSVAKEIGKRWKTLSDSEKAKYAKKGASMKTRKSSRKASRKSFQKGMVEKKKSRKGTRKVSGYMKFAGKVRKDIVAENPSMRSDVTAVAKELGKRWRAMSDADKRKFD